MRWATHYSLVPWWLPDSDLVPVNDGEPECYRDIRVKGVPEREMVLHVVGQADDHPTLGVIAVRCERMYGTDRVIPLGLSIPDTPIVFTEERRLELAAVQSNPRRAHGYGVTRDEEEGA